MCPGGPSALRERFGRPSGGNSGCGESTGSDRYDPGASPWMTVPADEEPGTECGRSRDWLERHQNWEAGMRRLGHLEAWKGINPRSRTIGSPRGELAGSSTKGAPRHRRRSRPFIGLEPFPKWIQGVSTLSLNLNVPRRDRRHHAYWIAADVCAGAVRDRPSKVPASKRAAVPTVRETPRERLDLLAIAGRKMVSDISVPLMNSPSIRNLVSISPSCLGELISPHRPCRSRPGSGNRRRGSAGT